MIAFNFNSSILYYFMLCVNIIPYFVVLYKRGDIMQPLKGKLSITLDQDIIEKLKELSEYELRSVSQLINCILRRYFDNINQDN